MDTRLAIHLGGWAWPILPILSVLLGSELLGWYFKRHGRTFPRGLDAIGKLIISTLICFVGISACAFLMGQLTWGEGIGGLARGCEAPGEDLCQPQDVIWWGHDHFAVYNRQHQIDWFASGMNAATYFVFELSWVLLIFLLAYHGIKMWKSTKAIRAN